jgi:sec-independent protein translocase protein TatC
MIRLRPPRLRRAPRAQLPETGTPTAIEPHGGELRMSFFQHLDELRIRLTRAFLSLLIGVVIGLIVAGGVLEFLVQPYRDLFPEGGGQLATLGPTSGVVAYFRVGLLVGGALAIPMITYQVMMFVLPGLTTREKRYVLYSLPAITLLFLIGVAFTWYVLIPPSISFLEGFQPDLFRPEWTADNYLSFVTSLLFWMGVAFETPLIFFVLALLGLVSARSLIRNWRGAVLGTAIAAALITPTVDPVNMGLVMAPLMVLYILSIFLVILGRRINGIDRVPPP